MDEDWDQTASTNGGLGRNCVHDLFHERASGGAVDRLADQNCCPLLEVGETI